MQEREFRQALRSRHLSLIALGGIIGSAYFLGTGYLLQGVGPAAFLAYILGGLVTYLTMSCLSELTLAIPEKGSFIHYAARFISPTWSCGVGWSYWMTWVVYIPSECLAAGMIMHGVCPEISAQLFALTFGLVLSVLNICHVKAFGEVEFWLASIKILALLVFSVIAIFIFFGWIGNHSPEPIGTSFLTQTGGLFPNGAWVLLLNMVILLVNFQGSEIIGLSAAEAKNAARTIPKTINQLAFRIIGLYLIPTFLVAAIIPWNQASLEKSVFAVALNHYGFSKLAAGFTFVVLVAALSCANSGLFATVRSLHALGNQGMAPKFLTRLNRHGVPARATWFTLGAVWVMLGLGSLFATSKLYTTLLGISGFTGAVCWISICWCQLRFRRQRLSQPDAPPLSFKMKGFPYLTHVSIWIQVISLFVLFFNNDLRPSLYVGMIALAIPCTLYTFFARREAIVCGILGYTKQALKRLTRTSL